MYNQVHQLARISSECQIKVIRCNEVKVKDAEGCDLIIFSPGPCTPLETGNSMEIIDYWKDKISMLGICLGHQLLAHFYNAEVDRSFVPLHGLTSIIEHNGSWPFKDVPDQFDGARYHSLSVKSKINEFTVCAKTLDDENMCILREKKDIFQLGFQFHPESFLTKYGDSLIRNVCKRSGII